MKKRLLVLFGIALSIQTAQAGLGGLLKKAKETAGQAKTIAEQVKALVGPAKEYEAGASKGDKKYTPISVEIKNKGEDIWVALKTGNSFYTQNGKEVTKVAADTTQPFEVSIAEPYEILVWTYEPPSKDATPSKRYIFAAKQTAYVTADKGGSLRPQTGPAEGRLGKTDTGLSLSKNVKAVTVGEIVAVEKTAPAVAKPEVSTKAVPTPPAAPEVSETSAKKVVPPPAPPAPKATPKVEMTTPEKASSTGRSDLLSQIREGKALRPVEERKKTEKPESSSPQTVADLLKQSTAFKKRTAANAA